MRAFACLLLSFVAGIGCLSDPGGNNFFNRYEALYFLPEPDSAPVAGDAAYAAAYAEAALPNLLDDRLFSTIASAKEYVWVAFESLGSTQVAEAIIAKHLEGVPVRVVGDVDNRNGAGFVYLEDTLDGLEGNTNPIEEGLVRFGNEIGVMTTNMVLVDDRFLWVSTWSPQDNAQPLTTLESGFLISSNNAAAEQNIINDFKQEYVQLYGGLYGDIRRRYGEVSKSHTNGYTTYQVSDVTIRAHFGPQERLVKQVIDEIYLADGTVDVATELLGNRFAADALIQKANFSSPVQLILENTRWQEIASQTVYIDSTIAVPGREAALANLKIAADNTLTEISGSLVAIDRDALPPELTPWYLPSEHAQRTREGERFVWMTHNMIQDDSYLDGVMLVFDRAERIDQPEVFDSLHRFMDLIVSLSQGTAQG